MNHFGEHLTIDGYGGDPGKLDDRERVLSCLTDLPQELGMRILGGPEVYRAEPNSKKDPGGWTGIVAIQESHISIHTFPKRGFFTADVYTCKNGLDVEFIVDYFTKQFGLKSVEQHFIKRGTRYPERDVS